MWSLLGCFLLSIFLVTGNCLQCEMCYSAGNNCTGKMKTCGADQDSCIISLTEYLQPPMTITFVGKDCGTSNFCKIGPQEIHLGNGMRMRTNQVCYKENQYGTVSLPVLPPPDTKPNGLQCPGCLGLFSTKCNEKPVACTGQETKCIDVAGNTTVYQTMDIVFKGCANEAFCTTLHLGHNSFAGTSVDLTRAECNAAVNVSTKVP